MALTQSTKILGLSAPNAYYNFDEVTVSKQENGDYLVELLVNEYTDSSKENHVSQEDFTFEDVKEADLNFANYYALLKTEEKFSNAIDA
jgi:hypothetical protein